MIRIIKFKKNHAKPLSILIRNDIKTLLPSFYNKQVIDFLCKNMDDRYLVKCSEKRDLFVAIDGKNLVGIAGLEDDEVRTVYVDAKKQNRGIGRKLMERVEKTAKRKGYETIKVRSNLYSVKFYEKIGYRRIRKVFRRFDEGIVLDEVLMKKSI